MSEPLVGRVLRISHSEKLRNSLTRAGKERQQLTFPNPIHKLSLVAAEPLLWTRSLTAGQTLRTADTRKRQFCSLLAARVTSVAVETGQEWPYLRPLLLTFFASQRRSAFAAKTLVKAAIEMYQQGIAWSDISLELKLAGIREGEQIDKLNVQDQKKARLLVNLEKDVLLQWIGLIFMTLEELQIETAASDNGSLDESTQMLRGMRDFVKRILTLGYDSQRLQLQQQMALDEKGEALPSIKLMQENARLIILAKEIATQNTHSANPDSSRGSEESVVAEVNPSETTEAPRTADDTSASSGPSTSGQDEEAITKESCLVGQGIKQQAARILLAFLGAAQGSQYSVNAFLEEVYSCYMNGWAAYEVYSALSLEDFLCGKSMFPIAAINGSAQINADVFGHWVSTVYITLAQIGVPHKVQKDSVGWAWASPLKEGDAAAANRLSNLVSTTLSSKAKEEGEAASGDSEALAAVKALPRTSHLPKTGHDFAVLEDPHLAESSSAMGLMSQLLNLVTMTKRLASLTKRKSPTSGL